MNEAWLRQWTSQQGDVLRRAKADVAKVAGGGNATLAELKAFVEAEGQRAWTLLEMADEYVVIKLPAPTITTHLGQPTLV